MPDNIKENEFLKQNQAAQFVKRSTDVMSKQVGGFFANTAKAFTSNTDVQLESGQTLKRIDSSLNIISKILQQQIELTKRSSNTRGLQPQTKKYVKDVGAAKSRKRRSAKDFVKRQDPDKGMRENIGDIENLLTDIRDNDEESRTKAGKGIMGLLGGLGSFFVGSGLVGYLMTGKKEFLFSVVKGLTKYIGKGFKSIFKLGGIGKKFKSAFSGISKFAKSIGGFIKRVSGFKISSIGKFIDRIKDFGKAFTSIKGISRMFKTLFKGAKTLFKTGGKSLLKGIGKGAKTAFKKIPIVGALLGVFFGIQRFRKGDWIGGLLEVVSGIVSIIPGVGTAISVVIDGILLFRDFKGVKVDTPAQKMTKKITKNVLRNLPGIGMVWRMVEAFKLWKDGEHSKALRAMAKAMAVQLPFGGILFEGIASFIDQVQDNGFISTVSSWFTGAKSAVTGVFTDNEQDKGGDKVRTRTVPGKRAFGVNAMRFAGTRGFMPPPPLNKDRGFNPKTHKGKRIRGLSKQYDGIELYTPWNPDFEGLQPDMKNNFLSMAKEYYYKTGDNIQVNSGKRSGTGRSTHNYGWAIDINRDDANALEKENLLQKYGFHRPLLNWSVEKEPWHVEPYPGENVYGARDTINNNFRVGTLMNKAPKGFRPEQGGDEINLPKGFVENKIESDKPMQVMLSNEDMDKLIIGFGEQIRRNRPQAGPRSSTQAVSGRKL